MNKVLFVCLLVSPGVNAHAETRAPGSFFSPEKLKEMSTLVFRGTVLEIETIEKYKVTFPVKAKVAKVLKGELKKKELAFKHKSPGKHIIIKQEFNTPKVEQEGTFYIQDQGGMLVLIGYIKKTELKEINPIEKSNVPDKQAARKAIIQNLVSSKDDGLSNTQRVVAHSHFAIGFDVKGFAGKGDRIWQIHLVGLDQTAERIFWLHAESKAVYEITPKK